MHKLLERFYRVILIGTRQQLVRAENWLAAAGAADLLVVTSTVREDTGFTTGCGCSTRSRTQATKEP